MKGLSAGLRRLRDELRPLRLGSRRLSSGLRMSPGFLILGAQKCGTTHLFQLLAQHPSIVAPLAKEIHYFSLHYGRDWSWYLAHFPMRLTNAGRITGEASPLYLFVPNAAERVHQSLPLARLIVMLRNPVSRAYSQYQHYRAEGRFAGSTFEDVIDAELKRLESPEISRLFVDGEVTEELRVDSCVARGLYAQQIRSWLRLFPLRQLLVIGSEELFSDTHGTYDHVCDFLDVPRWRPRLSDSPSPRQYERMASHTRDRLSEWYRPHNKELCQLIGRELNW